MYIIFTNFMELLLVFTCGHLFAYIEILFYITIRKRSYKYLANNRKTK